MQQLCNDAIAQETDNKIVESQTIDTLQNSQCCTNTLSNEGNKFILMINDEGQHILALQSEINTSSRKTEQNVDFDTNIKNAKNKIWNINFNSIKFEESAESIKKIQSNNEKLDIKNANDFFSIMISPFENNVVSSTPEMEHLKVPSSKRRKSIDSYINTTDFPQTSDNIQMNIVKSTIEQNFNHDKDINDPLQTINEESLKELLYDMDRK